MGKVLTWEEGTIVVSWRCRGYGRLPESIIALESGDVRYFEVKADNDEVIAVMRGPGAHVHVAHKAGPHGVIAGLLLVPLAFLLLVRRAGR